ncbi:hypothetical protein B9T62_18740 [Paenibacillus donghaensis]|uniref:Uncharacterized protein n=1 Tax=Paenibacillus donghaensis TaxID=414771 RepID=A0A2Z2K7W6_9BACL|nr:hypothetical protein B9T62_18740 [Paenibacillus donghaensis]
MLHNYLQIAMGLLFSMLILFYHIKWLYKLNKMTISLKQYYLGSLVIFLIIAVMNRHSLI